MKKLKSNKLILKFNTLKNEENYLFFNKEI